MKAILEFNLPEDREEYDIMLKGNDYLSCLYDISMEVFRPARKHGYPDKRIQELLEKNEDAYELIGLLEEKFADILTQHEVDIY
jgi:hypothetical protein